MIIYIYIYIHDVEYPRLYMAFLNHLDVATRFPCFGLSSARSSRHSTGGGTCQGSVSQPGHRWKMSELCISPQDIRHLSKKAGIEHS